MKNLNLKALNTKTLLTQLGLEPRRSAGLKLATGASMLGVGAALGVGAMYAARLPLVQRWLDKRTFFKGGAALEGTGETLAAKKPLTHKVHVEHKGAAAHLPTA